MEKLDVMFTINSKYIDIMMGSIYSLLINSNIPFIRIHIINNDFNLEDYKKIESALSCFENVEYYFYEIDKFDIEKFNIPNWRGTQIANSRLFFQDLITERISSITNLLYLDADTVVVGDLTGLEKAKNNVINAVKEGCYKEYYRQLAGLNNYYNSGVLFFNINKWLNENYQDKIIRFIERNTDVKLSYPDQDIINCALFEDISDLPLNYNMSAMNYLFGPFGEKLFFNPNIRNVSSDEIKEAKKNPKILHSTGVMSIKPWTNNNINPFNEEFMKYILLANPHFEKEDIDFNQKLVSTFPFMFKTGLIIKSYIPENVKKLVRKNPFVK